MSFDRLVRKKTINGKEFQIHLLGAGDGIQTVTQISDLLIPLMGAVQGGADEDGNVDLDFGKIATVFAMHMGNLDILAIITRLLKGLAVDGSEVKIDEYFVANYGELIAVMAFALQENFSSFFDAMDMLG